MTSTERKGGPSGDSVAGRLARFAVPPLGLAGMAISGYLTYVHYSSSNLICLFGARCDVVLTSSYAQMWGLPLSLFGLAMYFLITVLGLMMLRAGSTWEHLIALETYALALAGVVFTGYLYYLEVFVLRSFCSWCIISSVVLVSILVLSIINFISIGNRLQKTPHTRRFKLSDYVQW